MVYSIYVIYIRCGCGLGLVCIYIFIYLFDRTAEQTVILRLSLFFPIFSDV